MSLRTFLACLLLLGGIASLAQARSLEIYFVDVEGGQATLIVSPSGQSMLVDTGWRGFDGRDAERIMQAVRNAKLKQIDYLLITHYHRDHVGGVPQLANRIKIGTFLDHGPNTEESRAAKEDYTDYVKTFQSAEHVVLKPGEKVPLKGVTVQIVGSSGEHISTALPGGGQPNPFCATSPQRDPDPSENSRSVGFVLTYDNFRFVDLGDLTWNKELELMCPNNVIGPVDVYLTSHHGLNQSGSPALVKALHPRVAIMNNGPKKGGSPDAWQIVKESPGLEDLWQLHYALEGGKEHNVPDPFIANVDEFGQGQYLKLTAESNGSFTVFNQRNKYQKQYKPTAK